MKDINERAPAAVNGRGAKQKAASHLRDHSIRLPANWRDRLPNPGRYFGQCVECLGKPNASGWAQGRCPLHEDHHESLSVHIEGHGGWRCFAGCGQGDLIAFHMRLRGCDFKQAVSELVRGDA